MDGTEFTPTKLKLWLKENKDVLNTVKNKTSTSRAKFADWFDLESNFDLIEDVNIDNFVNDNYNVIFK